MKKALPALALALCSPALWAESVALPKGVQASLEEHCLECHDAETKKGGLNLEKLGTQFREPAQFEAWLKVHDRVRAHEMPPKKKARPPQGDLDTITSWLNAELTAADKERQTKDVRVGVRRLSRVEFENTLRDLLGLPGLRVQVSLPADGKAHGFDRGAEALDFSFVHLDSYLSAVDSALLAATPATIEQPAVNIYHWRPQEDHSLALLTRQAEAIGLIGLLRDETFVSVHPNIFDDEPKSTAVGVFRHGDADFRYGTGRFSPKVSGLYRIRLSGYSFHWDGLKPGPTEKHGAVSFGVFSQALNLGMVDLPPNRPGIGELTVWLDQSNEGLMWTPESCERLRDFAYGPRKHVIGPINPAPGVAVEWIDIEGPLNPVWPPAGQSSLFGNLPVEKWMKDCGETKPVQHKETSGNRPPLRVVSKEPEKDAQRLLASFLRRAFRRSVSEQEVATYQAVFTAQLAGGEPFQDALKAAYRLALNSPDFLLLRNNGVCSLASRLSYFLWSGPPDEELLTLAEKGELAKPEIIRAQVARMLLDKRAARFVEDFTGQWLRLREIDSTQPDKVLYPEFTPLLQESMLMETRAYFSELLNTDLGVSHFVKSDFGMLNETLAESYGIPGVSGNDIHRVLLPPGCVRGPFLTQGSVLKISANGTTTSPVTRGAFVMEKILGIVPTPPPPGTGSIEPDTRGTTTVREQLEKHKKDATCASCHVKMDPYGFALESFDVIGAPRDFYRALDDPAFIGPRLPRKIVHGRGIGYEPGKPVDCTGELPDGRPFNNIAELQTMLAADEPGLARAFVGQLISYATGAPVSFADRAEVEKILARAKDSKYGVRTLLVETAMSPLFAR